MGIISADHVEIIFSSAEEFVCRLYGFSKINLINEERTKSLEAYKIINTQEILKLSKRNIAFLNFFPPSAIIRFWVSINHHEYASSWKLTTLDSIGEQEGNNRNSIEMNTVFDNVKDFLLEEKE